jgi:hypothetical protein
VSVSRRCSSAVSYATASGLTLNGFQFIGTKGNGSYFLAAEGPQYFSSADYDRGTGSSLQGPALTSSFYSISNGALTITMPLGGVTDFGLHEPSFAPNLSQSRFKCSKSALGCKILKCGRSDLSAARHVGMNRLTDYRYYSCNIPLKIELIYPVSHVRSTCGRIR